MTVRDKQGHDLLYYACDYGYLKVLQLLMDNGLGNYLDRVYTHSVFNIYKSGHINVNIYDLAQIGFGNDKAKEILHILSQAGHQAKKQTNDSMVISTPKSERLI